jgi:hypothetical protein
LREQESLNSKKKIDTAVGAVVVHDRSREYVGVEPWMAFVS